ncbi:MAG: DUF29 domain-containing protein [Pseudomonadota bacterium]
MNQLEEIKPDIDIDYVLWMERQIALIRGRQFAQLDLANLLDELEYIVASHRRELRSRLRLIVVHLLKCECQPGLKTKSWLRTLFTQRDKIEDLLENSPSLAREVYAFAVRDFARSRRAEIKETGLPASMFPRELPYSESQLLDVDFIP